LALSSAGSGAPLAAAARVGQVTKTRAVDAAQSQVRPGGREVLVDAAGSKRWHPLRPAMEAANALSEPFEKIL